MMSRGTDDKIEGRVKEAAGALFGDGRLEREGQADEAKKLPKDR